MTKVVLADRWVDASGVKHSSGEVVEVDSNLARRLIYNGQARLDQTKTVSTKASPKTRRAKKVSDSQ